MATKEVNIEPFLIDVPTRVKAQTFRIHGRGDWFVLVSGPAMALVTNLLYGKLVALVVIIITACLLATADYARVYVVIGVAFRDLYIKKVKKGVIGAKKEGRTRRSSVLPLDITIIRDGEAELPLIHNYRRGEDAFIIVGDGATMVARGVEEQAVFTDRLARAIRQAAAAAPGVKTGFSWIFMRRNQDLVQVGNDYGQSLRPEVVTPPTTGDPDHVARMHNLHSIAEGLFEMSADYGDDVVMAAVITVRREGSLSGTKGGKKRLSELAYKRLAVRQIADNVITEFMAAGVANPRLMTTDEVFAFLRGGWDINDISEYQQQRLLDPDHTRGLHWPQRDIVVPPDGGSIIVDGSHHAVIRMKANPDSRSLPVKFRQLYAPVAARFVTITGLGMTLSTNPEYRALDRGIPIMNAVRDASGIVHEGPRARHRRQRVEQRQELISESVFKVDASRLVVVSAATAQELETAVVKMMNLAKVLGLAPKRVTGPTWVTRFFWSAVTGLNLL